MGTLSQSTVGTPGYSAPEQKTDPQRVDSRADIFSLGAVLYEMATGRKAFSGTSQASLISSIMKEEPSPISTLAPMSPPALDRVVKTCLAKDPEDRWQSAHDVGNELKWIAEGSQAGVPVKVSARRKSRERLAWLLVGLATAIATLLAVGYLRRAPQPAALLRASLVLPERMFLADVAMSPDARKVAFTMLKVGATPSLWVRDLDAEAARQVPGADEASFPFWSPDSRFIAFFSEGKLKKVEAGGGPVMTVCDAEVGLGGSWNREGTIVFAPSATSPLFRVSASGGKPAAVTKLDTSRHEAAHRYPYFLPDGRHVLYTVTALGGSTDEAANAIHVASLDGKTDKTLVGVVSNAQYAAGQLFYVREGSLLAQRFDVGRLEAAGEPIGVAPRVGQLVAWRGFNAFSASGDRLVLAPPVEVPSRLLWVDRSGKTLASLGEPSLFDRLRLSPDGRHVAVPIMNFAKQSAELWVYDTASGSGSKFVFAPAFNGSPVWAPDGQRVFFSSDRKARSARGDVWSKPIDGSSEEPFLESGDDKIPLDWSRDGRYLAIRKTPAQGKRNNEIWIVDAASGKKQTPFATEAPNQDDAQFSPDGKWIAYDSDESGTVEVYVRPFPGPGGKWKVSTGGGGTPRWRGDGKELFYLSLGDKTMAVPIGFEPAFHAGVPAPLFTLHVGVSATFDVDRAGQRFLVSAAPEISGSPPLDLLVNWAVLLKKNEASR